VSNTRENLQERVQRALLQEAILRPESALVISVTLLLGVFAPQVGFLDFIPFWVWLLGGLLAEGALVYSSLTDPEFGRKVVARLLQRRFRPEQLQNKRLQERINEAFDYRSRIEAAIREHSDSLLKDELYETARQIDEWLEHIYNLARHVDRYQQERAILARDYKRTTKRIQELQNQIQAENDTAVRAQMETTLASLQRQLATLTTLDNTIQRAELQLENSHAHLATIYSQTMLIEVKDIDSGRARRLRQEIAGEVDELQDMLAAMDEVYAVPGAL